MPNVKNKNLNIVVFGSGYLGFEIAQKLKNLKFNVLIASRTNKKNFKKKSGYIYKEYRKDFKKILKNQDVVICANGPIGDFNKYIDNEKTIKDYKNLIKKIYKESLKQGVKKFIYLSSIHSLIKKNKLKDTKMYYYSKSKKVIEKELIRLSKGKKIDTKILRLTNIFGYTSKKKFIKSKSIINNFITQSRKTNKIKILSKENFKRIFLPINIFLEQIIYFIENNYKAKLINIGNKKYYFSILQIAKEIQRIVLINKKKKIEIISDFSIKKKNKQIDKFKYFNNNKILFEKKNFLSQLSKMI